MLCPVCQKEGLRYGKNRNGTQRFYCRACYITFSETRGTAETVFADRQLTVEKAGTAIRLLMEGASIRAVCRLLRLGQHTLLDFLLKLGEGCAHVQRTYVARVPCRSVQCDELWSFVWCKEKTRARKNYHADEIGDCYTWTAIDPHTKLLLAYAVGKRDNATGIEFVQRLRHATSGRFQINTDGLTIYRSVIPMAFGDNQDHAHVIKIFNAPAEGEARYSPPQIVEIRIEVGGGKPNLSRASTSMVERHNLTVRMMLRRFTRLTNAHSRSWRHHEAAIALLFAYYNFVRPHMTLTDLDGRKRTPAMEAGISDHVWSVRELIEHAIPREAVAG